MSNDIKQFFHCKKCLEEKPDNMSPRDWSHNETGWTEKGFQVWCIRHRVNIINVDFLGQKHIAIPELTSGIVKGPTLTIVK